MDNWFFYVVLGLLIGGIIAFVWEELNHSGAWSDAKSRISIVRQQRIDILKQLDQKPPEKTDIKNEAVTLVYKFAASQNHFSLKDIETFTRQIQNYYLNNLNSPSTFKMNFPEKKLLNFDPAQTLMLLTIINEGLHNAALYSNANFIFNIAYIEDDKLHIITHDNGIGYDRNKNIDAGGINKILKAITTLKGDLKLTSTAGNGTVVNTQIPLS
ncbi:MAG: histidine kinase [Nonlabens sp.]|uniref:histidine kinase n=1 Tax=Nonlabens sp. TaxID=1888209 RepID=UPI0032190252